jgi:hypothetical protein
VSGSFDERSDTPTTSSAKHRARLYGMVYLAVSLLIIGFAVCRDITVGADYARYGSHYYTGRIFYSYEPGFSLLSKAIASISTDFNLFSDIILALPLGTILVSIYRNRRERWLSIALLQTFFIYAVMLSAMRQAVAYAFVFLAVTVLLNAENKQVRRILPVVLIFIAVTMHYSAVSALALVLARQIKTRRWLYGPIVGISLFAFLFRKQLLNAILSLLTGKQHYMDYEPDWGLTTIALLLGLLILTLLPRLRKSDEPYTPDEYTLIHTLLLALIFNIFFSWIPAHYRITQYFFLGLVLLLPKVFKRKRPGDWLMLAGTVLYYMYVLQMNDMKILPYRFSLGPF